MTSCRARALLDRSSSQLRFLSILDLGSDERLSHAEARADQADDDRFVFAPRWRTGGSRSRPRNTPLLTIPRLVRLPSSHLRATPFQRPRPLEPCATHSCPVRAWKHALEATSPPIDWRVDPAGVGSRATPRGYRGVVDEPSSSSQRSPKAPRTCAGPRRETVSPRGRHGASGVASCAEAVRPALSCAPLPPLASRGLGWRCRRGGSTTRRRRSSASAVQPAGTYVCASPARAWTRSDARLDRSARDRACRTTSANRR